MLGSWEAEVRGRTTEDRSWEAVIVTRYKLLEKEQNMKGWDAGKLGG